ncbi:MAG: hypothetical protein ABI472_02230 [Ginsengibacter sp.]
MKNFLFAFAAGCIPALAVTSGIQAQNATNVVAVEQYNSITNTNKAALAEKDKTASLHGISTKAVRDFKKSFKNVSNEKWFPSKDGFTAIFALNGVTSVIYYDKKGHWAGSVKAYDEDKLNPAIRDIVKRKYYDFNITSIDEVETIDNQNLPVYIVHLEDANSIKLVRVSDGEMDVYEEFKKTD